MRSSEMFLELWLLRYRAKGRNEQNVVIVLLFYNRNILSNKYVEFISSRFINLKPYLIYLLLFNINNQPRKILLL
jgi:hypothetical protein